ncbi:MerR family transcriptional regulator [Modestobacter sp. Leaf380]|uniref:MerR family transcriptional regulator n=1 Tax=Modestobacter sp. Leaf380 TaxID=1736356 RepID=UPI001F1CF378|nr:MerR family transcriptional regulator [Modestobacter sp. Leaf380]
MLIGEVARTAGVSTRTIRHYHQLGVVPEPARRASGYREYDLADVLAVVRAVRLAERGLSLPEVRDVLHDDTGTELRAVLQHVVQDIEGQIDQLTGQRRVLLEMLDHDDLRLAHLPAMPPALVAGLVGVADPGRLERERDAWESIAASVPHDQAAAITVAVEDVLADPGRAGELAEIAEQFEALTTADDPAVRAVAQRMVAMFEAVDGGGGLVPSPGAPLMAEFLASLTPGQRRCMDLVRESTS